MCSILQHAVELRYSAELSYSCSKKNVPLIKEYFLSNSMAYLSPGGVGHDHVQVVFAESAIILPIDFVWDSWTCHFFQLIPL